MVEKSGLDVCGVHVGRLHGGEINRMMEIIMMEKSGLDDGDCTVEKYQ